MIDRLIYKFCGFLDDCISAVETYIIKNFRCIFLFEKKTFTIVITCTYRVNRK